VPKDDDPFVTTPVAAKAIGVAQSTLASWVQRGLIKPHLVTLGGQYRWQVEKLKAELRAKRDE
jgi:predicted site-specific integrase-resolvase